MSSLLGLNCTKQDPARQHAAASEPPMPHVAGGPNPELDSYTASSIQGDILPGVQVNAATTLQAAFRASKSRRTLVQLRRQTRQKNASTRLASQWRGYKARQEIRPLRAIQGAEAPPTQVHFLGQTHWSDAIEEMNHWDKRKSILSIVRSQVQIANYLLENALEPESEIYAEGLCTGLTSEMAWRPTRLEVTPPPREPGFYLPQDLVQEIHSTFSRDPKRFPRHPRDLIGREQLMTLAKHGAATVLCVLGIIGEVKAAIPAEEQDRIYKEMNAYTQRKAGIDIHKFMSRYSNWHAKHPELRALVYDAREACLIKKIKASDATKNKIVIFGKNHDFSPHLDGVSGLEAKPHFY